MSITMHVHKKTYEWLQYINNHNSVRRRIYTVTVDEAKNVEQRSQPLGNPKSVVTAPSRCRHTAQIMTPATFIVCVFSLEQHDQSHRKSTNFGGNKNKNQFFSVIRRTS